ncbi:MAG: hypothetical protein ACRERD_16950 [Candidatus Binatia bacterium]
MPALQPMPPLTLPPGALVPFGAQWTALVGKLSKGRPYSSLQLGDVFDQAIGASLSVLVGGVLIVVPNENSLTPSNPDCVEVGTFRVIGAVRPQNFDVGYRPDGVRFAHDTKTLNSTDSVTKNWQNMINDLATEATNVHSRFPHAVVTFVCAIPRPCIGPDRLAAMIETFDRLQRRVNVEDSDYMAEAISFVLWDPATGIIDPNLPDPASPLRIERFHEKVEPAYVSRYKGMPPHTV